MNIYQQTQLALNELFYSEATKPKTLTIEQRKQNVDDFIAFYVEELGINPSENLFKEPSTRKKDFLVKYSLSYILGNYLLAPVAKSERSEEYPVRSHENHVRDLKQQAIKERYIVAHDAEKTLQEQNAPLPAYSVRESDVRPSESPEDMLFKESKLDVDALVLLIENTKADAANVACDLYIERGYSIDATLLKIRALDSSKVVKCPICDGPYYRRNSNRNCCDSQIGIVQTKGGYKTTSKSMCDVIYDRNRKIEYAS